MLKGMTLLMAGRLAGSLVSAQLSVVATLLVMIIKNDYRRFQVSHVGSKTLLIENDCFRIKVTLAPP